MEIATLLGDLFKYFSVKKYENPVVEKLYIKLLENKCFKTFYAENKMVEYLESFLQIIDVELKLPIFDKLTEFSHKVENTTNAQIETKMFSNSFISSEFQTVLSYSQYCQSCNLNFEKTREINRIKIDNIEGSLVHLEKESSDKGGFGFQRIKSMFSKNSIIPLEKVLSFHLKKTQTEKDTRICTFCNQKCNSESFSKSKVSVPQNLFFELPFNFEQTKLKIEHQIQLKTNEEDEENTSEWFLSFVLINQKGSNFKSAYVKQKKEWIKITYNETKNATTEFQSIFDAEIEISMIGYTKTNILKTDKFILKETKKDCITVPFPIIYRHQMYNEKIDKYLQNIYCEHFNLKPALFSVDCLDKSKMINNLKTATSLYQNMGVSISKKEFMKILEKENLFDSYLLNYDKMKTDEICAKCCDKSQTNTMIGTLISSIKVKFMENKNHITPSFIRENKEFFELVFNNKLSKLINQSLTHEKTNKNLGDCNNENLNKAFSVLFDQNLKKIEKTDVCLIGDFEKTILELLMFKTETKEESIVDENWMKNLEKCCQCLDSILQLSESENGNKLQIAPILISEMKENQKIIENLTQKLENKIIEDQCCSSVKLSHDFYSEKNKVNSNGQFCDENDTKIEVFRKRKQQQGIARKYHSANSDKKQSEKIAKETNSNFVVTHRNGNHNKPYMKKYGFPVIQIDDDCSSFDPMTSPANISSIWNGIEIQEVFNIHKRTSNINQKMKQNTPKKLKNEKTECRLMVTPIAINKYTLKNSAGESFCEEKPSEKSKRKDTPINYNQFHFFDDPFRVLKVNGLSMEGIEPQFKPGFIQNNQRSKFYQPQNNSIISDVSRSEISSFHRSVFENIIIKTEVKQIKQKISKKKELKIKEVSSANLKELFHQSLGILKTERKMRVEQKSIQNQANCFLLIIKKENVVLPKKPTIINLAINPLEQNIVKDPEVGNDEQQSELFNKEKQSATGKSLKKSDNFQVKIIKLVTSDSIFKTGIFSKPNSPNHIQFDFLNGINGFGSAELNTLRTIHIET